MRLGSIISVGVLLTSVSGFAETVSSQQAAKSSLQLSRAVGSDLIRIGSIALSRLIPGSTISSNLAPRFLTEKFYRDGRYVYNSFGGVAPTSATGRYTMGNGGEICVETLYRQDLNRCFEVYRGKGNVYFVSVSAGSLTVKSVKIETSE